MIASLFLLRSSNTFSGSLSSSNTTIGSAFSIFSGSNTFEFDGRVCGILDRGAVGTALGLKPDRACDLGPDVDARGCEIDGLGGEVILRLAMSISKALHCRTKRTRLPPFLISDHHCPYANHACHHAVEHDCAHYDHGQAHDHDDNHHLHDRGDDTLSPDSSHFFRFCHPCPCPCLCLYHPSDHHVYRSPSAVLVSADPRRETRLANLEVCYACLQISRRRDMFVLYLKSWGKGRDNQCEKHFRHAIDGSLLLQGPPVCMVTR